MKVIEAEKIMHHYHGELLTRAVTVELAELDENDESTQVALAGKQTPMRYQVSILHPKTAKTARNEDKPQSPEIFRFMSKPEAEHVWRVYVRALGGDAPEPVSKIPTAVDLAPLLARLSRVEDELAAAKKTK